jgi:hypothetical protein
MIAAFLLTALAAVASEPATSTRTSPTPNLLSTVLEANERVQMNSCLCDASGGAVTPSLDTSDRNLCSVIDSIAAEGHPDVFNPKNPYGMCAPSWKSATPYWQTPDGMKLIQAYGTAAFQAVTRAEFVKRGHALLSDDERASARLRAVRIRGEAATQCCGTDATCAAAMNSVTVKICESDADHDANALDWCEATAGKYVNNSVQMAVMTLRLRDSLATAGLNSTRIQEIVAEAQKTLGGQSLESFPDPVVGEIQLSPYSNTDAGHFVSDTTYRHEFGHACSYIRRQLLAKKGNPHAGDVAMTFFQRIMPKCENDSTQIENAYGSQLERAGSNRHVFACLSDLASKSTDVTSSAYIPNSCPAYKIEEIMADAFSMYTGSAFPEAFPERACNRYPSTMHGAPVDVLTCMLSGDAHFRQALKTKLECSKERR